MILGSSVSSLDKIVGTFLRCDGRQDFRDGVAESIFSPLLGFAQPVFELREELFNGIEVWRVFGKEEEFCAGRANGASDGQGLMRTEIVHHDDVARLEGGNEDFFDVDEEARAIDWPFEKPRRHDAVVAQGGHEGHGLPPAIRHLGIEALANRRPSPERRHIGFGPGLVDEHQPGRIDTVLIGRPLQASARHIGPIAFAGDQRLFL